MKKTQECVAPFELTQNNGNFKKQLLQRVVQWPEDRSRLETRAPVYIIPCPVSTCVSSIFFERDECLTIPSSPSTDTIGSQTNKKPKQKGLVQRYAQQQAGKTREVALLPSGTMNSARHRAAFI